MSVPAYPEYKDSGVAWLGDVPSHWEIAQFKRLIEIQNGSDYKHVEREEGYPVIGSGGPFTFASDFLYDGESVLLGRKGTVDKPLYVTGRFWTVDTMYWSKIRPDINGRFAFYTAVTIPFSYYTTSTALPSMTQSALNAHFVSLPPQGEQAAIAAFLDRETGKIDALVAEQQRLIALLKEKRQAVISHAVTKGLNPNAPMKDSGIEWLGDIPAHWEARPLKGLIRPGSSISYGIVQPGEHLDDGVPFIQTTNMTSGRFDLDDLQRTSPEIETAYPRSRLKGGEVILGIRASIGACHVVPDHLRGANLSRGVARIECSKTINSQFTKLSLQSGSTERYWQLSKQGSTFNEVSIDTVKNLFIAVPPLNEQSDIVMHCQAVIEQFSQLLEQAERSLMLLQERRAAMISAAVTGKIDVRELAVAPAELEPA